MILIAHRGNTNGPNPSKENNNFSNKIYISFSAKMILPIIKAMINTSVGKTGTFLFNKYIVTKNMRAWKKPQIKKFTVTPCHIAEAINTPNKAMLGGKLFLIGS